jgi:hypothetical protein
MKMSKYDQNALIKALQRNFATKEDLKSFATKVDLAVVRGELKADIVGLRVELKADKGELEVKIAEVKSDVIHWMFAFFVTMLLAILGLYFKK